MTVNEVNDQELVEMSWHKEPCMVGVGALCAADVRELAADEIVYMIMFQSFAIVIQMRLEGVRCWGLWSTE